MSLSPPSQPTHAPLRLCIAGRSAVASPPGDNSQPSSPRRIGSLLAIATTGRWSAAEAVSDGSGTDELGTDASRARRPEPASADRCDIDTPDRRRVIALLAGSPRLEQLRDLRH